MLKTLNSINKKIKINSLNKIVKKVSNYNYKESSNEDILNNFLNIKNKDIINNEDLIIAYSLIKEVIYRKLGFNVYDVQILGSLILSSGNISEMKTGEGKTLVSVISACINYLYGKTTHIITVNDYLAERDFLLMKPIFDFFSINVDLIKSEDTIVQKKESYKSDVIYGTSKTFVFDYLRDNVVKKESLRVQRSLDFAIIDEVDSILIDEARIPMNMSTDIEVDLSIFYKLNEISKIFIKGKDKDEEDFYIDLKDKSIEFTDQGFKKIETIFIEEGLINDSKEMYSSEKLTYLNNLEKAIRANHILEKDVDYVIVNNEIVIIDENTGRLLPGRRWNSGLHQAVEAKEGLEVTAESVTIASITLQNYFKLYKHLSGMTGTALTEEEEFKDIYDLEVYPVPTNKLMIRKDLNDLVFKNKEVLFEELINVVKKINNTGQPILIGTQSLADSEVISNLFKMNSINHSVLNAKNHMKEAQIIAEAGCEGAITIATNMAGRGTDIMLGGNRDIEIQKYIESGLSIEDSILSWEKNHDKIVSLGGLYVIGIERAEARRLDNQLIGRSGRQGDPGTSIFFVSLEDELLKPFAGQAQSLWASLGIDKQGVAHPIISKTLNNAQKKKEGANYNMRKMLLKYDNINSEQRNIIYKVRNNIIKSNDLSELIKNYVIKSSKIIVRDYKYLEIDELLNDNHFKEKLLDSFNIEIKNENINSYEELEKYISSTIIKDYFSKRETLKEDIALEVEKEVLLKTIDNLWVKHLSQLENMRKNVSLKAYANKNPLDEYQKDSLEMFNIMLEELRFEITSIISQFSPWLIKKEDEEAFLNKIIENSEKNNAIIKRILPIIVKGAGF